MEKKNDFSLEGGHVSLEFILEVAHSLSYILARFEHSSDVLCINGIGEVGIAEVAAIVCLHTQFLSSGRTREKQGRQHDRKQQLMYFKSCRAIL